jgi:hypothetical protein
MARVRPTLRRMSASARSISPERDLPSEEERERLLDALTTLVRRMGFESLVSSPLVVGTREFFPEPVPRTVGGLRGVLRRLLVFAGLSELQPGLHVFEAGDELSAELADGASKHTEVPAFFAGIEEPSATIPARTALFGFDVTRWGDPELLLGALAHEVAHAYRRDRGLEVIDRETEERLTDLTAVVLGFGPLVVNAAYIHRSTVEQSGGWVSQEVTLTRAGYLPAEELAFLLAVVVRVRDLSKEHRRALLDELAGAQRRMVEASLRALPPRGDLLRRLALPEPATWPRETRPTVEDLDLLVDQGDDDEPLVPEEERDAALQERPTGVTYRLATPSANAIVFGAMVGTFLGLVPLGLGAPKWTMFVTMVLGPLVMRALLFTCADPACGAVLLGHGGTCRGCGRPIRGTLRSPGEWLELSDAQLEGSPSDDGGDADEPESDEADADETETARAPARRGARRRVRWKPRRRGRSGPGRT